MSDAALFAQLCNALEQSTQLNKLESRGTIRLGLKSAGLDARHLDKVQAMVVLDRILPAELKVRGVGEPEEVCSRIAEALRGMDHTAQPQGSPEAIFRRIGG